MQLTLQVKDKMTVESIMKYWKRSGGPQGLPSPQDFNTWLNPYLSGIGLPFGNQVSLGDLLRFLLVL